MHLSAALDPDKEANTLAKDTKVDELVKGGSVGDIAKAFDAEPANVFILPLLDGDTPTHEVALHTGKDGKEIKIIRIWRKAL